MLYLKTIKAIEYMFYLFGKLIGKYIMEEY